jgi:hypothetical protein
MVIIASLVVHRPVPPVGQTDLDYRCGGGRTAWSAAHRGCESIYDLHLRRELISLSEDMAADAFEPSIERDANLHADLFRIPRDVLKIGSGVRKYEGARIWLKAAR